MEAFLAQEPMVRLGAFASIFVLMALWEILAPRRERHVPKGYRWLNNLAIVAVDSVAVRVVFPAAAVGVALFVEAQGWGLLRLLEMPYWLVIVLSVIVLDFAVWAQHVFFHAVEILLSMLIKAGVIVMLGVPAVAVLLFEVLLNATSIFNHGNVRLPQRLDRVLRWIVVTPEMHRVHHSWYPNETNSNFGFNLPWWDRLFGRV